MGTAVLTDVAAAVTKLRDACNKAYDSYPSSCSHSVWAVLKAILAPNEPYRVANALLDHMQSSWRKVSLDDGFNLANKGIVVVGGAKVVGGNGHVIVVYPGPKKMNGGYQFFWKKGNKYIQMKATAMYPLAMSTSIGTWPGAKSRGDKTVWDPWATDEAFKHVQFWTAK